jgi:hypothetical protein
MTEREKFWQMLTICTDVKSFKYDTDKKTISVELPILPENVKDFKKNILTIFGNPKVPTSDWESDLIYHAYKFDSRYIDFDNQSIVLNKYGQLSISNDNVVSDIENSVLQKLSIDVKNDPLYFETFQGFGDISEDPFVKNNFETNYRTQGADYSDPENWYLFPQRTSGKLDVFLLYPSTEHDDTKDAIVTPGDQSMSRGVIEFLRVIAPIFKGLPVNLYMPKIRQINRAKVGKLSLDLAADSDLQPVVADVFNSFTYFLKECQSAPEFITFSHEQGSLWNYFLATEFNNLLPLEVKNKWINVWALGLGLDKSILQRTSFGPSGFEDDAHTIISWNIVSPGEFYNDVNKYNWGDGSAVVVNPISFSKSYEEKQLDTISLINYFSPTRLGKFVKQLHQINNTVKAKTVTNTYGNEIVEVNLNETDIMPEHLISLRETNKDFGYLMEQDIGLFAMNIRNNIILRYGL